MTAVTRDSCQGGMRGVPSSPPLSTEQSCKLPPCSPALQFVPLLSAADQGVTRGGWYLWCCSHELRGPLGKPDSLAARLDKSVNIYQLAYTDLYKDKQDIGNLATYLDNEKERAIVPLIIQVNPSRR